MNPRPFAVGVDQHILADLERRLAMTRWPDEVADAHWDYGFSL